MGAKRLKSVAALFKLEGIEPGWLSDNLILAIPCMFMLSCKMGGL